MSDTATIPAVVEALAEALERMAFVSLLPCEQPPAAPESILAVNIRFGGPVTGTIDLMASRSLGLLLASNVLGLPEDDAAVTENAPDALREMLNVTCGVLMPMLNPAARERCEMHVPDIRNDVPAGEWDAFIAEPGTVCLDAEGHSLAVRLRGA